MTLRNTPMRSMPLRATDGWSIDEGVPEPRRNIVELLLAALRSWLRRPRRPPDVPDYLRADLGLPPADGPTSEARWRMNMLLIAMAMKG